MAGRSGAYDDLVVAIDVAGLVREQRRWGLSIDREHALLSLVGEVRLQFCPHGFCALRWAGEKVLVTGIGPGVPNDEIPNVDGSGPIAGSKTVPAIA
jgi:hypothetical protein